MRKGEMIDFQTSHAAEGKGTQHRVARGQNFYVEWIKGAAGSAAFPIDSAYEMMVLLPDVGATIEGGARSVGPKARSGAIVPAGEFWIQLAGAGSCCVLKSNSGETDGGAVANRATYAKADPRVAPFGPPYLRRVDHGAIRVFDIDAVQAPKDNPRLKMLQSATMSINWVEYDGPRDRKALSPHSHKDFEQGSLALAGEFRHHLRVEWGSNANLWQDDLHVAASSPSVLIIPPEIIHTSEGVNGGRHLLIDIFSPPRKDFIAKNWTPTLRSIWLPAARRDRRPAAFRVARALRCRWSRRLCHASLL
jgi:hypothetical protein